MSFVSRAALGAKGGLEIIKVDCTADKEKRGRLQTTLAGPAAK